MRHRAFPFTAGDRHGVPNRVRAPHRGAWSKRKCSDFIGSIGFLLTFFSYPLPVSHRTVGFRVIGTYYDAPGDIMDHLVFMEAELPLNPEVSCTGAPNASSGMIAAH